MGKLKNIGGLWLKEKNGKKFMTGSIEIGGQKHRFMVFKNDRKEKETQPDYQLLVSEEESAQPTTQNIAQFTEQDIPF